MRRKWRLITGGALALLAMWITADFAIPRRSSLIHFDGRRVGDLETAMWRSYYGHQPVRLFGQLTQLLREQYYVAFWRACAGAYDAARAAVVFQRGHNRAEYELALPSLVRYYALIRRDSDVPFPVEKTARLELEWWIIHRERAHHAPGDLERSLAALQAAIYSRPEEAFAAHAKARAEAMLLRDADASGGIVSERDWDRIQSLLEESWVSLQTALVSR
jgi:hypothetical protein